MSLAGVEGYFFYLGPKVTHPTSDGQCAIKNPRDTLKFADTEGQLHLSRDSG